MGKPKEKKEKTNRLVGAKNRGIRLVRAKTGGGAGQPKEKNEKTGVRAGQPKEKRENKWISRG